MKVLGDRPYPLKESIKEYLEELEKRRQEEENAAAAEPDTEAAAADADPEAVEDKAEEVDAATKDGDSEKK